MQLPKDSRWTVLELSHVTPNSQRYYKCQCSCGAGKTIKQSHLLDGRSKSCGCLARELTSVRAATHGMTGSSEYIIWRGVIQRCSDPGQENYHLYGGRGITFDPNWKRFENFYRDMGERPSAHHSIERRDNNGNYSKDNCVWATRHEQARNTTRNVNITYDNKTQCLTDWAEELGLPYKALHLRITRRNWSVERAFTTPLQTAHRKENNLL